MRLEWEEPFSPAGAAKPGLAEMMENARYISVLVPDCMPLTGARSLCRNAVDILEQLCKGDRYMSGNRAERESTAGINSSFVTELTGSWEPTFKFLRRGWGLDWASCKVKRATKQNWYGIVGERHSHSDLESWNLKVKDGEGFTGLQPSSPEDSHSIY